MTTMTREQRIARANEIFDRVWGDEGKRSAYSTLEDAACDLRCAAEDLKIAHDELLDEDISEQGQTALSTLYAYVEELAKLAARLDDLDLDERAA